MSCSSKNLVTKYGDFWKISIEHTGMHVEKATLNFNIEVPVGMASKKRPAQDSRSQNHQNKQTDEI